MPGPSIPHSIDSLFENLTVVKMLTDTGGNRPDNGSRVEAQIFSPHLNGFRNADVVWGYVVGNALEFTKNFPGEFCIITDWRFRTYFGTVENYGAGHLRVGDFWRGNPVVDAREFTLIWLWQRRTRKGREWTYVTNIDKARPRAA